MSDGDPLVRNSSHNCSTLAGRQTFVVHSGIITNGLPVLDDNRCLQIQFPPLDSGVEAILGLLRVSPAALHLSAFCFLPPQLIIKHSEL